MFRFNYLISRLCAGTLFLAVCLFASLQTVRAESDNNIPVYSPVINGEALRGLSSISSAEAMGAGRMTFGLMSPWYRQRKGYLTTPNTGANLYTAAGSFSYGVNSYVDLFASVAGFASNNYNNTNRNAGLGSIRAGAQGALPLPRLSFLRIGGQTTIIGGTSQNKINTYRADGYNYFETRTDYGFMGKLLQTFQFGTEDWGFKAHFNEAGVMGINKNEPVLLLLGTGVQANLGFAVLGAELNSRTQFNSVSFGTDPLWFTPSLNIRSPFDMNAMVGVDIALSADRSGGKPRALEPYRIFAAFAFSMDMLAGRRAEELARKEKAAKEKAALELEAAQSAQEVKSLTEQSADDSAALVNQKQFARAQMNMMENKADIMASQATADSLALIQAANELALEKEKRTDAEKQLLSTGELLLDAVYFNSGKTVLTMNSKPYLNIIGKMLLKYPKLQIEVAGHTDNIGGTDYNMNLSEGRANAVRGYLVEIAPALGSFLGAHGYGESKPKTSNDTKEGRQINRRVELRVTNMSALKEYSQAQ